MKNERYVPEVFKAIGKNIKKAREELDISQEELAEQIGKSPHLISMLERGRSGVSIPTIINICNSLNIDANFIFADVIKTNNTNTNDILTKSFNSFEKSDKEMVAYLINYINSKN